MYRAHREVGFFHSAKPPSAISSYGVAANGSIRVDLEEKVVRNAGAILGATGFYDRR